MTSTGTSTMTGVSSYALTAAPRFTVMQAQAALSKAQVELSSGRLADVGLGLGATTGTYVALGAQASRLQSIKDSNGTTTTTLAAAAAGLDALRTTASAFLASLTEAASAGNGSGTLATTASANLGALTATLNTTVGGVAVFGGINSGQPPMATYGATNGSPPTAKDHVDSTFLSRFGMAQDASAASTISGADLQTYLDGSYAGLFSDAAFADPNGSNWSSASDQPTTARISATETVDTSVSANGAPFRQLAQAYAMVREFGGANFGSDASKAVIASATKLVSSALSGLTTAEAGVGQTQAAVSDADDRMTAQIGYLSTQSSELVGVDPAAFSVKISGLQTQIQASYEITSELQQLSLVNYLK